VVLVALAAVACGRQAEVAAAQAKPVTAAPTEVVSSTAVAVGSPKLCEHGVPADLCTKCDPDLIEVFKEKGDWCGEHGVPESHCLQCNPKLDFAVATASPAEPFCGEHGVPEAMCTKCKPQLVAKYVQAGDYCREHGLPESVCPFCHPELAKAAGIEPPSFPPPGLTVKLANPDIARKAGITTEAAQAEGSAEGVEVVGQIEFDANRLARLSPRSEALVREVKVDVGDPVRPGQAVLVLASASVGEWQAKRAAAATRLDTLRSALAREEALLARGITSKQEVEQALAAVAEAQEEHASAAAGLASSGAGNGSGGTFTLKSPIAGVVVDRKAAPGQSAAPGDVLLEIADTSKLWAILDVPEEHAARVRVGQQVTLQFDRGAHPDVTGTVTRVAAAVDRNSRTVKVRVEVANPDRTLRAGLFVRARIDVGARVQALFIPRDAVQQVEGQDLVFVPTGAGVYEPRAVEVRPAGATRVAVLKGLDRGAHVVVAGAFLLKTEILKDSIGAGCADDH
jgi:cobalt-zinc-cadmium efflux system membrane fusion protein